jgi:glycosyltransferase involved in cell wall biosynthesis
MRVVVVSTLGFPDTDVFAREQTSALTSLGHEAIVLAPPSSGAWAVPMQVEHIPFTFDRTNPLRFDASSLEHAITSLQPDVVHIYAGMATRRLARSRLPAVFEIRSIPIRLTPARQIVFLRGAWDLRNASAVGCTNLRYVRLLGSKGFVSRAGYSSWAHQARSGRYPTPGLCVYQGSLSYLRRLDGLLDAFSLVRSQIPNARLQLLGFTPPDKLLQARIAGDRWLGDAVEFVVRPSAEMLRDAFRRAELALSWVPRDRGYDCQPPVKILDALAAGVPVVATDTRASRVLLERYGGGVIGPSTAEGFANAIVNALGSSSRVASAGRDFLCERSWVQIMRRDWIPAYERAQAKALS